jgi:choice-of-anchor B domain-containing protein
MDAQACYRLLGLSAVCASAVLATAQYARDKVTLHAQISLAAMSATSGNSCWGYTSPSGREYALMGCNNKLAVVEITNPAQPNYFASIPHSSSTWADIKVYGHYAYLVTETAGTGIQVIDLSQVDNGIVTLVRTIPSPGRSHTIHVDTVSGFLYTCGSRDGTGTTMCFSLADPANPVRVGANTMTPVYQHEAQMHTYTSGQYAGRQIMFGAGEGRGLEIWDLTDKDNPFLIRRVAYPFVGYCHQGWLSPDKRYFYVNDEFDESQNQITTRTLIFDVSVLETADLVATFSTGRPSIDHNLYNRNGFIFEANYTTGLWVFDGNSNPVAPAYRGFFDTYPANDNAQFDGAWSNYPFFPSGTVIVSDINRGLFILDTTEATKTKFKAVSATIERGAAVSGSVADLENADNQYFVLKRGPAASANDDPLRLVLSGPSLWQDISKLSLKVQAKASTTGLQLSLELYDFAAGAWVQKQTAPLTGSDVDFALDGTNVDRFVAPGSKEMRARLVARPGGPVGNAQWQVSFDSAYWEANP